MMDAQQSLFTGLKMKIEALGLSVYDGGIVRAAQAPLAVALTGSDDVPGLFQLPDCGPDRVDLLPVDKGQTFQRIVPIFRQGEHLR